MTGGAVAAGGRLATTCCIAGGGPAGMMLGLLLARAGIDVVVLEKHADFLRDFRGDTIHPSTLQVMHELGLLEELLKLPHNKLCELAVQVGDTPMSFADFSLLPPRCAFIALMPQWDFLDFLAGKARSAIPTSSCSCRPKPRPHRGAGTRRRRRAMTPEGRSGPRRSGRRLRRAPLDVARAGAASRSRTSARRSTCSGSRLRAATAIPRRGGRFDPGSFFATIDRGDYWQCAYVIPKGGAERIRRRGLPPSGARRHARRSSPIGSDELQTGTTSSC